MEAGSKFFVNFFLEMYVHFSSTYIPKLSRFIPNYILKDFTEEFVNILFYSQKHGRFFFFFSDSRYNF